MACISATNALVAQRAAVRTNKRCVHVPGQQTPRKFHAMVATRTSEWHDARLARELGNARVRNSRDACGVTRQTARIFVASPARFSRDS
jgi:hypothetical protein